MEHIAKISNTKKTKIVKSNVLKCIAFQWTSRSTLPKETENFGLDPKEVCVLAHTTQSGRKENELRNGILHRQQAGKRNIKKI